MVVEFAFHRISLTKFLIQSYRSKVETIFSQSIWPGSRLIGVANLPAVNSGGADGVRNRGDGGSRL